MQRNKTLEEQLRLAESGKVVEKQDTVTIEPRREKCLVLGDFIVRNVGADKSDMRVKCFPGIRTDQLRRVIENRDLGCLDSVVIHVGTNDFKRFRNLDLVMGEAHNLVNTAKTKFPESRLVVSGVLRSRGVSRRCIGAANRLEWIAGALGATFVDPNCWIQDEDFGRDGLHLNRSGASQLGELYSRVCERGIEHQKVTEN
jgi:hypothetical protein